MVWVSLIFLIIAMALSRPFYKGQLFNPAVVFFALWFFAFSLLELNDVLNIFYSGVSSYAGHLYTASFFAFLLGSVTVATQEHGRRRASTIRIDEHHLSILYKITKIVVGLFFVTVLYKYFVLTGIYGNPFANVASMRIDSIEETLKYPLYLYLFTIPGYVGVINLGILFVLKRNKKVIFLIIISFALVFLNDLSMGGFRGGFLNSFLMFLSSVMITTVVKGEKAGFYTLFRFTTALVAFILIMTIIFYLRSGGNVEYVEASLWHNYIYIAGPVSADSYFLDYPWDRRLFGQNIFQGLYQLIDLISRRLGGGFLSKVDTAPYYADITDGPFNSGSYLTYFYSDFGVVGVFVMSYVLGLISTFLYFKALAKRRVLDIQFAALLMATLLLSIRGVITSGRSFWIMLLFVVAQHYVMNNARRSVPDPVGVGETIGDFTE